MDLEKAKAFFEKFIEADYQAQFHKYGEETAEALAPFISARRDLFSPKIKTRAALPGGPFEQRKMVVRRKLFALAQYETEKFGTVCAGYLSGNHDFSVDSLDAVYFAADVDGKPLIVRQQGVDTDGDASTLGHASGEDIGLGEPSSARVMATPSNPGEAKLLPSK